MQFATCVPKYALEYIQKIFPDIIEDDIKKFLEYVKKDIVRVQDPLMHGNKIAIIPGTNYDSKFYEDLMESMSVLIEKQKALEEK